MPARYLCLHCASVVGPRRSRPAACPSCGAAWDYKQYDLARTYAGRVARFGVIARRQYERSILARPRMRYITPSPSDTLVFVTLAAISGVLGNVAYDIVKTVIRKILKNAAGDHDHPPDEDVKQLTSDEAIDNLFQHIQEFIGGLPTVDPAVKAAVLEELLVHHMTDIVMESEAEVRRKRGRQGATVERIRKRIAERSKELFDRVRRDLQPLTPDELQRMWDRIDLQG